MEGFIDLLVEQGIEGIGRYYSIYRGFVTNNQDKYGMGRVRVYVPGIKIHLWALPKGQHGGFNSGFKYLTPGMGSTVWVEFEGGDLSKPVWSFYGWANGEIPLELDSPNVMGFRTPNGNTVTLDEEDNHLDAHILGSTAFYGEDQIDIASKEKVVVNSGNNGGVVNIEELTAKLNKLVKELEELKAAYNIHTHSGVMVGTGVSTTPISPYNNTFSTFNKSDYEDTKFTH